MARSKKGAHPAAPAPKAPSGGHGVAYAPPRRFPFDPNLPQVREIAEKLPAGLFAVVANDSARYTSFMGSVMAMVMPNGSRFAIHTGCYVVDSCNRAYNGMSDTEDWVMLMGDDHHFPPEMALKLLGLMYQHDLDIIAPLCFKRDFPPSPVVYKYDEATPETLALYAYDATTDRVLYPINLQDYPEGGLIEVDAVGSAGMIVRRRVLEALEQPYFRIGEGQWGEDLDFCRRAQAEGFKVWVDLDMPLGHIVNTCMWPVRSQAGEWMVEYDFNQQGGFRLGI